MQLLSATDVRKEWSVTMDSVVREKPQFIKRTRDIVALMSMDMLEELLDAYSFHADAQTGPDGAVTLRLRELELYQTAADEKQAAGMLAEKMLSYAEEFYEGVP